jgi:hypothetical protein
MLIAVSDIAVFLAAAERGVHAVVGAVESAVRDAASSDFARG